MTLLADQTLTLAANEQRTFGGPIRFIFFRAVSAVGVVLRFDVGRPSQSGEAEVSTNYEFQTSAQTFALRNSTGAPIALRMIYGDGDFNPGAAGASVSAAIVGTPDVNIASIAAGISAANRLPVRGGIAPAAAVGTIEPVLVGGSDPGALARVLAVDAGGRSIIVGAAAAAVAPVGNPVLTGGTDGAAVRALLLDASGRPIVVGGSAAGVAPVGNPVPVAGVDPGGLVRIPALSTTGIGRVSLEAGVLGGMTRHRLRAAATTNATNVKNAAGKLYSIHVANGAAAARWFKLHDTAAAPTVGVTAVAWSILIPAGGNFVWTSDAGMAFPTGISYSTTQLEVDTDATALAAAGELHITLGYA